MARSVVEPRLTEPGSYEKVFRDGERVLLTCRARWPRLEETAPGLRRVNRYYAALARHWQARWEGPLLERSRAAAGPDTPLWEAGLDFTVTLLDGGLFSLYLDVTEDVGGKRPRRLRLGDVWLLPDGVPLTLRELLPPGRGWQGKVLERVRMEIGRRLDAGESVFCQDWPHQSARRFSPERCYLTAEGPVVFYPIESIAPAMEGFPTFQVGSFPSLAAATGS